MRGPWSILCVAGQAAGSHVQRNQEHIPPGQGGSHARLVRGGLRARGPFRCLGLCASCAIPAMTAAWRPRSARASGFRSAIPALGPSYIKLGQFLATRPDVVGPQLAGALGIVARPASALPRGASQERKSKPRSASPGPPFTASSARPSPRLPSRRCTRPSCNRTAARMRSRSRSCGPASRSVRARSRKLLFRGAHGRALLAAIAQAPAGRRGRYARAIGAA